MQRVITFIVLAACTATAEPQPDMFTTLSQDDLKKPGLIKEGAIQLSVEAGGRVVCYAPLVGPYFLQASPRWTCDAKRRRCVGGPNVVYWDGTKIAAFVDYKAGIKDSAPASDSAAITDEVEGRGPACTAARAANALTSKPIDTDAITDLWEYVDVVCKPGDTCRKSAHHCGGDAGKRFASWWDQRPWRCDRTLACDASIGYDYWMLLRKGKRDRLLPWLVGNLDRWTTEADIKPRADRFAAFTKDAATKRCP